MSATSALKLSKQPAPAPAPAAPIRVKMLDSKTVLEGRLLMIGQEVDVSPELARALIDSRAAIPAHVIRVKLLREAFIGNATLPEGFELDVTEDLAGRLYQESVARILTPERLRAELPRRRTEPPMTVKLTEAFRKVRTVVTAKSLVFGSRVFGKGDQVVLEEPRARLALASKAVVLAAGETLHPLPSEIIDIPPAA